MNGSAAPRPSPRTRSRGAAVPALARGSGVQALLLRAADGLELRRARDGRLAFPYVAKRTRRGFHILTYHRVNDLSKRFFPGVPPNRFRRQMEALAGCATVRPLGELVERMDRDDVPPRSLAITFDDGYRDNYEHAFPVLRNLGLPATVFLTTGPIETGAPLWHDRVFEAFEAAGDGPLTVRGRELPMRPFEERARTLASVLGLLRASDADERDRLIAAIEAQLGCIGEAGGGNRMLDWTQIGEMARHGVTFGAHTVSHPILTRLTAEDAEAEIRDCRRTIERRLDRPVDQFAYPNGTRADFDDAVQGILREQGFRCAVTTLWGGNRPGSNPFELRRIGFWDSEPEWIPLRLAWYRLGT